MDRPRNPEPFVGQPATIHFVTDSAAAVVVKVNPRSVVLRRVETTEPVQDMSRDGADYLPVMESQGILDRLRSDRLPERFMRRDTGDGPVFRSGSIGISLGRSVTVMDYRF